MLKPNEDTGKAPADPKSPKRGVSQLGEGWEGCQRWGILLHATLTF